MRNFNNRLFVFNRRQLLLGAAGLLPTLRLRGAAEEPRLRARALGLAPGVFDPGPLNAITDVPGVRVGHTTLIEGSNVRTGVTAILPHSRNLFQEKVAGAVFVGNAFGKLAGSTQVQELGTIETPIVLTNTLSVGTAVESVVAWTLAQPGNEKVGSVNALVGETNDGQLNDIRGQHVHREHVISAISNAKEAPVQEGSVGAGTGTVCFSWKGGIGTSSRVLPQRYGGYRLGALVQTNFGGVLTMGGAPIGKELKKYAYSPQGSDGSCMIVIATDAPASGHECRRLAARGVFGLARTGSSYSNGSGDFAIAFSTAAGPSLSSEAMSPLFEAALEAVEEAVYNSLLAATTMQGNGRTVEALPIAQVRQILKAHALAP
jgi:D-aminopeptidase